MDLIERLRERRVTRWVQSTGMPPKSDGFSRDALCVEAADEIERLTKERDALRLDADLLTWVLEHPETAAEELGDAAAGEGEARANLERRRASIAEMLKRYGDRCDEMMKEKP